jgi:hypothetical protein
LWTINLYFNCVCLLQLHFTRIGGKSDRVQALVEVSLVGAAANNCQHLGIPSKGIFQQSCQLGISVRYVIGFFLRLEFFDHQYKHREGGVDVLGLGQQRPVIPALVRAFVPGKINDVKTATPSTDAGIVGQQAVEMDGEEQMRAG